MTALFVLEEWRFILELLVAEFLFVTPSARRRDKFALRCIGGTLFCMGVSLLYCFVQMISEHNIIYGSIIHIAWYIFLTVLSLLCILSVTAYPSAGCCSAALRAMRFSI